MPKSRAIRIDGSDKALLFLNGDIEQTVLRDLLYDATERGLALNSVVIVTHNQRVKNFIEDDPEWEDVEKRVKLREVFDIYERTNHEPYRQPSLDQRERDLQNRPSKRSY